MSLTQTTLVSVTSLTSKTSLVSVTSLTNCCYDVIRWLYNSWWCSLVCPVAMYGCESWTLKKDDEYRISAFEMKCLRQVLRVSWTAKRTNEWVLETAGVSRSLLASVKEMKLAYYRHILRKKGDCLEKELIQGTTPGPSRTWGRPKMTWIDNKIMDWVVTDRTSKECGR